MLKRCNASFVKPVDSLPIYQLIAYRTDYKFLPINLKEREFSYCFQITGIQITFSNLQLQVKTKSTFLADLIFSNTIIFWTQRDKNLKKLTNVSGPTSKFHFEF